MAKTQVSTYIFKPGLGATDNLYPDAYSLLNANKSFIQKEATAWIQSQVDINAPGFSGYTYNATKCERDVGYIIDAYLHDLRYGGNETLKNTIKYYWDQDVAQVDGDRQPEIQTHTWIGNLIKNNIFTKTAYSALNTQVTQITTGNTVEATSQFTPTDANYTPTTGEMTLTIGSHNINVGHEIFIAPAGITFTCSLDGNATLHPYPRATGVPNATGKDPFYYAPVSVTAVTSTTITVNVGISSDTSTHTFVSALTNAVSTGPSAKIDTLVFNTVDVIENGLTAMPTLVPTGIGTVKIQGSYELNELLLITNVTANEIIYNFSSPQTGGTVVIKRDKIEEDVDFPKYLQTTDGITTIKLNYNTQGHSSTDSLQIFVEKLENGKSVVTSRPFDFGTDAIERMRVAPAVSMLDADFEYGLQPTKWAAIAAMRGYPSVYEIPGTDTPVQTVISDASEGTEGVGQSLITVTTIGPHGFEAGTPITIKALEDSVAGAARAEGSFVIVTVPSNNQFQFYAKSKVGVTNPTVISTTYTQLRKAGFYTGATIGTPDFQVISQGSAGTMFAQLDIAQGSTIIPFDGPAPELGSPLTNASIPLGSQVTGINDTSAGGGEYLTAVVTQNAAINDTRVFLESTTGIINNLAVDRGDGTAVYVTDVQPTYIDLDGNLTSEIISNKILYTGVSGINDQPTGINAEFDITLTNDAQSSYSVVISAAGTDYAVGNRILIDGSTIGGQSLVNDALIRITSVGSIGEILTISVEGVHWDGTLNITGASAQLQNGSGSGARFDLAYSAGAYTSVTPATGLVTYNSPTPIYNGAAGAGADFNITRNGSTYSGSINTAGVDYVALETFTIPGSFLGGTTPNNDATVTIDTVGVSGNILTITVSGTAFDTSDQSSGYAVDDTLKIDGSVLGGIDEFNDVFITVTTVDGTGAITGVSFVGDVPNISKQFNGVGVAIPVTYSGSSGTNAVFQVTLTNGLYAASIQNAGVDYLPTETLTVSGADLGGATPANDLVITIDNVDGTGGITAISTSGTGTTDGSFDGIPAANRLGNSATFDISIAGGNYTALINTAGANYGVNQTLVISGSLLSGSTPANDLTITITSVDTIPDGAIQTITVAGTPATAGGTYTGVSDAPQNNNGISATFDINREFTDYITVSPNAGGSGYDIGDRLIIAGSNLDGTSPANDISVIVSQTGAGGDILQVTFSYFEAANGANFSLISTILMSEATNGIITRNSEITYSALATVEATFSNAHGLVPGSTFIASITSDTETNNHNLIAGSYIANDVPAVNKFRFQVRAPGFIDVSVTDVIGEIYPRPDSFFIHRPFDGGVQLGTGGPQHGAQAIRQSKKYIRYQSGKGIMYTTGALFAPSYDVRSITAEDVEVGSLITIVTDDNDHGVQVGGVIRLLGVETPGFNSGPETAVPPQFDYTVVEVVDERTFKVRSVRRLGATDAVLGFGAQMSVVSWHGATVRSGIFDEQNGIFWEYDGTNISVNQRTGTQQLAGTISLQVDNNLVSGINTRFEDQLKAGDRIIIKGMTHVVSHVNSQTEITVTPDWRGVVDIEGAKANLVVDKKVKQENFNLDTLDGRGPSGYDIDIAKMQMIGIQYSWYGAGFIDFMLRGADGNFVFAHRMRNSNVNTEAFMRSGNLPVRYEVTNEGPSGKLKQGMDSSQQIAVLDDSSFFPDAGTIYIDNEIMTFTGNNKSTNSLTGLTRGATFVNFQAGSNRSYSAGPADLHSPKTGVILLSQTITPLISHWGSAFITDGGFDEDRGYIFSYAETAIPISTTKQTAFMIRLSPSVSNALIGDLGERELLNRAQLLLQGLEITSEGDDTGTPITGGIVIEGILNPQNYPLNPNDVGWSGLSGVAQGGQPSFAQIASGGSVVWSTGETATSTTVTAQAVINEQITSGIYNSPRNRNYVFINTADHTATFGGQNIVGKTISGTNIRGNTTITEVYISGTYGYYRLSRNTINQTNTGTVDAFTISEGSNLTDRNFALFNKASFETSGAAVGTVATSGGTVSFPANTLINNIALRQFGTVEYYEVQFNNSFSGTLAAGSGTVEFTFEQPPYAQPGETVFSFIAVPGERSTVDFSQLKELTNTPLGGRGTYPNGPDVLAINVYKVSGQTTTSNIILKWGEAQA